MNRTFAFVFAFGSCNLRLYSCFDFLIHVYVILFLQCHYLVASSPCSQKRNPSHLLAAVPVGGEEALCVLFLTDVCMFVYLSFVVVDLLRHVSDCMLALFCFVLIFNA